VVINRVFVAWGRVGRRTIELAKETNSRLLFIPDKPPYIRAYKLTYRAISVMKPKIVIIQLPQGPLLYNVVKYKKRLGYKIVADVHTGFSVYESWRNMLLNKPFHKFLNYCEIIVAHNDPFREYLINVKKIDPRRVITVYDPFPKIPNILRKPHDIDIDPFDYIVFPAAWDPDEKIEFIINEYLSSNISKYYKLVITGNYLRRKRLAERIRRSSDKIILTGFLRNNEYYWVLKNSKIIITGTIREYTMLSSIWEAVALEKPFITNYTKTLWRILGKHTLYYVYKRGFLKKILDICLLHEECLESLTINSRILRNKLMSLSRRSIDELNKCINVLEK
jgi:hypothetical protein